jgi:hypothetical protein
MVKTVELRDEGPDLRLAYDRIERAMSYGCGVELVYDWFLKAVDRNSYHRDLWLPDLRTIAIHARDLSRRFRPAEFEVCNEFWYTKGNRDMTMEEYTTIVYAVADGLLMAGAPYPQLNASIKLDKPRDSEHDLWVWNIEYDKCAEVYHFNILSHRGKPPTPNTPEGLLAKLQAQDYCDKDRTGRDKAIGWIWPLKLNETSPVGDRVDLNTRNGAEMMVTLLRHQKRYDMPVTMLTMGGGRPFDAPPGEWGMRSDFVDDRGNLSLGVEAWLDFVDAPPYEGPSEPPVDPPDPGGWYEHLAEAQEDLDRAVKRGPNRRGVRSAERVIRHTEEAIGSAE